MLISRVTQQVFRLPEYFDNLSVFLVMTESSPRLPELLVFLEKFRNLWQIGSKCSLKLSAKYGTVWAKLEV